MKIFPFPTGNVQERVNDRVKAHPFDVEDLRILDHVWVERALLLEKAGLEEHSVEARDVELTDAVVYGEYSETMVSGVDDFLLQYESARSNLRRRKPPKSSISPLSILRDILIETTIVRLRTAKKHMIELSRKDNSVIAIGKDFAYKWTVVSAEAIT